ncbi:MAG: hypothetical protein V4592_04810 [Bacteroidota bacterium]
MKNKNMTYVLGLLVTVVWGLIIYRIYASVNNHDDQVTIINKPVKEHYNDYALKKDTAKLLLNYRDPFSQISRDTVSKIEIKHSVNNIKPLPQPAFNWGFIKYSGYVRNPDSKKLIAIMNINGKNIMLAEGETEGDVKLLKNMKDSIRVSFKNQTKFIIMNAASL